MLRICCWICRGLACRLISRLARRLTTRLIRRLAYTNSCKVAAKDIDIRHRLKKVNHLISNYSMEIHSGIITYANDSDIKRKTTEYGVVENIK